MDEIRSYIIDSILNGVKMSFKDLITGAECTVSKMKFEIDKLVSEEIIELDADSYYCMTGRGLDLYG